MNGSFLTLLSPATPLTLLHTLYGYVVPITIAGIWAAIAVLDLAQSNRALRPTLIWSAVVLGVPMLGGASYLLAGRRALSTRVAIGVVAGGSAVVAACFLLSFALVA